jgi:AcrR family transcriptional regulator
MATYGRAAIGLTAFALGMRMAPATIRRAFPDMDYLLAEILRRHLRAIVAALAEIPRDAPHRDQARRAAYLAVTRTHGAPTEAHLLLIRDRHLLPPDEAAPLEALRASIGDILAGPHAIAALALLDTPELTPTQIETALAALTNPPTPTQQTGQPQPPLGKPRLVHPQHPAQHAPAPHFPSAPTRQETPSALPLAAAAARPYRPPIQPH